MNTSRTFVLPDEAATDRLGRALAGFARPGDIIALEGTLGMGKSTLARAFIRALTAADEEVPSPTFTLVQTYDADIGQIWHFDLYRLEKPEDAFELGIEDAFTDGISLIEWPEQLGALLPRRRLLCVHLTPLDKGRQAVLTAAAPWRDRLEGVTP